MWTDENRHRYDRSGLRYPSDLTDEEWASIAPSIPPAKFGGNKRTRDMRDVVNGSMYVLSTGCQWRAIPKDLPPRSTVHDDRDLWDDDGTLRHIRHVLYVACREQAERKAGPTAAIIDPRASRAPKMYGPPRRQVVFRVQLDLSAQKSPAFRRAVGQDGEPRVLVLIEGRHRVPFFSQGFQDTG